MATAPEDDPPALEICALGKVQPDADMMQRNLTKGRVLGPTIVRDNRITASIYNTSMQRVFVGMDFGEILFWDVQPARATFTSQRTVGSHAVRLCKHCTRICTARLIDA